MTPKGRNGPVEQIRVLLVARRSAREQRIQTLNQLRHLVFTAPESIRVRYKNRYKTGLVTEAANIRPRKGSDPVTYTTNLMIRNLARRIKALNAEMRTAERRRTQHRRDHALSETVRRPPNLQTPTPDDLKPWVGSDPTNRLTWSQTTVLIMTCRPHPPFLGGPCDLIRACPPLRCGPSQSCPQPAGHLDIRDSLCAALASRCPLASPRVRRKFGQGPLPNSP